MLSMSEFGGLRKHEKTRHALRRFELIWKDGDKCAFQYNGDGGCFLQVGGGGSGALAPAAKAKARQRAVRPLLDTASWGPQGKSAAEGKGSF